MKKYTSMARTLVSDFQHSEVTTVDKIATKQMYVGIIKPTLNCEIHSAMEECLYQLNSMLFEVELGRERFYQQRLRTFCDMALPAIWPSWHVETPGVRLMRAGEIPWARMSSCHVM